MLVLGAENDGSFTTAEVLATARAYDAECEVFSNMGHDMMLESGWKRVAERIATWLHANNQLHRQFLSPDAVEVRNVCS